MTMSLDFALPWMLVLLPLAALPLLRRRSDTLVFSSVAWLPADDLGRAAGWLVRGGAALAIAAIVVGLAGPGRSQLQVLRTGSGAQILILMDRSASMDEPMGSKGVEAPRGDSKNHVARAALTRFVEQRPNDRLAFMMFGTNPVLAMPFTYNHRAIEAAVAATAIGRGMPDTELDRGMLAAIAQFDGAPVVGPPRDRARLRWRRDARRNDATAHRGGTATQPDRPVLHLLAQQRLQSRSERDAARQRNLGRSAAASLLSDAQDTV
ncbi:hypothetical protein OKW39_007864 [Paraburkholderia sp. MM6662-R1]